ncbi:hypothetical protein JVU11DRAFT_10037 [Chiua virens]|nr:hypothetical protein JVU11DRAFT_10037 [Chiua virens]
MVFILVRQNRLLTLVGRLLVQHQLFTHLLSGRLILAPIILSDKDEALDIGTGAANIGAWLCDARTHLPESVQLYGIDIESTPLPALQYSLSQCAPLSRLRDLPTVLLRLLILAYTREEWHRCIEEMYRVLIPGGYAQLIEVGPEWISGPKTAAHLLFMDEFLANKGMLMRCGVYIMDMMKVAGFLDVKCEEVVIKLGVWAGEGGIQGRDAGIGAWKGMRDSVMKEGGFGRFTSTEDFEKAADEVAEEWDNLEGSYMTMRAFYGRKPL